MVYVNPIKGSDIPDVSQEDLAKLFEVAPAAVFSRWGD